MIHCTGWYFCTKNNWDNQMFDVKNLVSIERNTEDFDNIINKHSLYPDDEFEIFLNNRGAKYWVIPILWNEFKNNKYTNGNKTIQKIL